MIHVKLASLDEVRAGLTFFKYVRMPDDSVRFVAIDFLTPDHAQMIDEGEAAKSAGSITVRKKVVELKSSGSSTLKISFSMSDDVEIITRLLFGGNP